MSATPVGDAPAATTDERTIRNPEATFGKNRAAIQSLCERSGGGWIDGMCILPYGYGIAFEWRNGRVYEHTILKDDPDFGRRMVREFRKLGGEEDTTVPEAGCKEWIWRNIGGRRYWVIVCPGRNMSSASARKLR